MRVCIETFENFTLKRDGLEKFGHLHLTNRFIRGCVRLSRKLKIM